MMDKDKSNKSQEDKSDDTENFLNQNKNDQNIKNASTDKTAEQSSKKTEDYQAEESESEEKKDKNIDVNVDVSPGKVSINVTVKSDKPEKEPSEEEKKSSQANSEKELKSVEKQEESKQQEVDKEEKKIKEDREDKEDNKDTQIRVEKENKEEKEDKEDREDKKKDKEDSENTEEKSEEDQKSTSSSEKNQASKQDSDNKKVEKEKNGEKKKGHEAHDKHEHEEEHDHEHHGEDHHKHMMEDFKKRFWISLIISLPILALSEMIQNWFGYELQFPGSNYVLGGLGIIIYLYGGWPFLTGLKDELKNKNPGMMTLIAVAITVAWGYSFAITLGMEGVDFYWELATLIVIMLLGHWLEMKSVLGASRALEELMELMPDTAQRVKENGETEEVKVSELQNGDRIRIKPGEKIAADGKVVDGKSSVNESMLTGESKPVKKEKGDEVIGGAVNDSGSITIEVEKTGDDSYLNQMVKMVKEAQKSKSKTQRLADKAAFILTIVSLSGGLITFLVWYLLLESELLFAVERTVTVMIIACPHALGLAIPLVVAISTSISAKNGLLIRNRSAFEQCRKLDVILFDKTGTLTKGEFGVTKIASLDDDWDEDKILTWAASMEQKSEHPLAAGILKKAKEKELKLLDTEDYENITGQGIKAIINGKNVIMAGGSYLKEKNIKTDVNPDAKGTIIYLVVEEEAKGYLALADEVREDSKEAVKTLHENDIEVYMITGDSEQVAKEVSEELGIEGYFADVMPEKKQDKVKELQDKGKIVAMTGDGVNDAPALAQANVGIAVGSGTDVAAETADIILANSNPKDIVKLILFGKATYNKMIQNLIWATAYNVVALPLAAGVLYQQGILVNPAIGAIVMSLSTVIVAINAQLLKYKLK